MSYVPLIFLIEESDRWAGWSGGEWREAPAIFRELREIGKKKNHKWVEREQYCSITGYLLKKMTDGPYASMIICAHIFWWGEKNKQTSQKTRMPLQVMSQRGWWAVRREISPLLRTHGPLRSLWKTVTEITAKPIAVLKCFLERWLSTENQHQMLHLAERLRGSYASDCCVTLPKGFCQSLTDLHQQHQFQSCFAFCRLSVCLQNLIDSYKDVLISS